MNTMLIIAAMALSAMIAILGWFSEDIIQGQKDLKDNILRRRKMNIYKISLSSDPSKELIKAVKKNMFIKFKENTERLIYKANIKITYEEYLIICILCAVIGWFIGDFVNNKGISLILAVIMYYLPKSYLKFVCESLKKQINEQLEPALSQIIGLLPTKKTLINACEACVEGFEEPLRTYFTEFINNINNANRSFEEALNELTKKIDDKAFSDFARLAVVHYKQGGETMYAFSSIPEAMRDIKLIQSEQETELDSLKMLGYMFTAIAPLSYVYYYFTDKSSYEILVNTTAGKIISFIAFVITIITIKLVIKISKPIEL